MEQIQFVCAFLSFQSTPQNPPNKRLLVCKEFSTFLEKADIFLLYKGPFGKFPLITGFSRAMIGTVHSSSRALVGMWAGELQLRIFKSVFIFILLSVLYLINSVSAPYLQLLIQCICSSIRVCCRCILLICTALNKPPPNAKLMLNEKH